MKKNINKGLYIVSSGRLWYALMLILLIQLYPVAVSDGQDNSMQTLAAQVLAESVDDRFDVRGIDISHHNKEINWETISALQGTERMHFCFMKATEGGDWVDKQFTHNWSEAQRLNIAKGAYHFYRPNIDPETQARNFINNVWLEEGDFAPVLDFEIQGSNLRQQRRLTEDVTTWLKIIEKQYGIRPIIYTNAHIYEKYIKDTPLAEYPIWASQYNTNELFGFENAKIFFWQHSQTGKTAGINGDVDHNVYMGSYLDLFTLKVRRRETATVSAVKV